MDDANNIYIAAGKPKSFDMAIPRQFLEQILVNPTLL